MPTIWNCPYCEKETYKELLSCPNCKRKFNAPWRCGNCGNDNLTASICCSNCGLSIKQAAPLQDTTENAPILKDPLAFLGPEHDFAMLKKKEILKKVPKNACRISIKKLRNFIKNITALFFSALIVTLFIEAVLREFPSIMPYANKWNYIHHYAGLARVFRGLPAYNLKGSEIIAFGDSFTRGAEVSPGKNWAAILNNEFGYNIFNLGVGGSSTVEQWVILKHFIFPKSVKHILLAINTSDIVQNFPGLVRHDNNGDGPFVRRARKAALLDSGPHGWNDYDSCQGNGWYLRISCWNYRSYLAASLINVFRQLNQGEAFQKTVNIKASNLVFDPISKRYRQKNIELSEFASQDAWFEKNTDGIAATLLIIKKIKAHLDSKNISLEVVYLPIAKEIYYLDWAKELNIKTTPNISAGAVLKPHILELGLPFKDIAPSLREIRKSEAPLYLPIDVHPNEKGHRFIAQQIDKFLKYRNIRN